MFLLEMVLKIVDFTHTIYIYTLMLCVFNNLHYFQTNSSLYEMNTRYENNLHIPSVRLAAIQRGSNYSAFHSFIHSFIHFTIH